MVALKIFLAQPLAILALGVSIRRRYRSDNFCLFAVVALGTDEGRLRFVNQSDRLNDRDGWMDGWMDGGLKFQIPNCLM
jgi:hypothetical protein